MTSTCVDNPDLSPPTATYEGYSTTQKMRFYALRTTVGLLIAGFVVLTLAMFVGIISCWSQRTRYLKITLGILCIASKFDCQTTNFLIQIFSFTFGNGHVFVSFGTILGNKCFENATIFWFLGFCKSFIFFNDVFY